MTATGGTGAAGIGGGWDTSGIDITANGGITKTAGGTLVVTDNNLQYWSAVPVGGIHDDEAQATYFYAEGIGHGVAYEDNYPRGTITLGKNMIIYGAPTVDPETSEDNVLTLTDGDYIRYQYMTIIPGAIATPTYSVTVIGGTNTTPDSESYLVQTELSGDMTTVTYTAKEGYLFPAIASAYGTFNGVTVALSANRKAITVSGTPTADVEVTIPDAAQEGGTTGGDTPSQQTGNTDGSTTSPKTGDNSHLGLWIAIMILSLCALAATLFIGKKKRVFDR